MSFEQGAILLAVIIFAIGFFVGVIVYLHERFKDTCVHEWEVMVDKLTERPIEE